MALKKIVLYESKGDPLTIVTIKVDDIKDNPEVVIWQNRAFVYATLFDEQYNYYEATLAFPLTTYGIEKERLSKKTV